MPGQHENSMMAYEETAKERAARREAVLGVYQASTTPLTDRDVMRSMGFNDPNAARPRITELVTEGVLVECGKIRDSLTRRLVRLTKIRQPEFQESFL